MDPLREIDVPLVERYLASETTEAESRVVDRWLAADPRRGDVVRAIREGRLLRRPVDPSAEWARIETMLAGDRKSVALSGSQIRHGGIAAHQMRAKDVLRKRALHARVWYTVASIVLVAFGVIFWHGTKSHQSTFGDVSKASVYATTNGQRANITLPDGNTVVLNVASRLEVPADYATGNHIVRLAGEALFTVLHHHDHPFTVVAGQTVTRVLGTSFVVRHYTSDSTVTIAVREGRVTVGRTVVTAAHQAEVGIKGMTRTTPANLSHFSFATGTLVLNGGTLSAAIPELNRWYDADIRLGDSVCARYYIKGKFTAGSLADLSAILALAYDVRVVRDGRSLTVFAR